MMPFGLGRVVEDFTTKAQRSHQGTQRKQMVESMKRAIGNHKYRTYS